MLFLIFQISSGYRTATAGIQYFLNKIQIHHPATDFNNSAKDKQVRSGILLNKAKEAGGNDVEDIAPEIGHMGQLCYLSSIALGVLDAVGTLAPLARALYTLPETSFESYVPIKPFLVFYLVYHRIQTARRVSTPTLCTVTNSYSYGR